MANFLTALKLTLFNESGYVKDPGDVYRGIVRASWPNWRGWKILDKYKPLKRGAIVADPDLEKAVQEFYHATYWVPVVKGDQIKNQELANLIFDWSIMAYRAPLEINKALQKLGATSKPVTSAITAGAIAVMNQNPVTAYTLLFATRKAFHIRNGVGKAKAYLKNWLERLHRYPLAINTSKNANPTAAAITTQTNKSPLS